MENDAINQLFYHDDLFLSYSVSKEILLIGSKFHLNKSGSSGVIKKFRSGDSVYARRVMIKIY